MITVSRRRRTNEWNMNRANKSCVLLRANSSWGTRRTTKMHMWEKFESTRSQTREANEKRPVLEGGKKKKNQWGYLFHLAVWQLRCQLAGLHYKHSVIYKTATVVHLSDFTTGCCYRLMMCVSYSESWIMIRLLQPHILVICSRVSSFWCKARVF